MAKTSQKKLRSRHQSDINGNGCHHNNNISRHLHSKKERTLSKGKGTWDIVLLEIFKSWFRYVIYSVVSVILFSIILHGQLLPSLFFQSRDSSQANSFTKSSNVHNKETSAHKHSSEKFTSKSHTAKNNLINDKIYEEKLPKEILNFKPKIQNYLSPKEILVDGRVIKPVELQHTKPNNGSVRLYIYENFLSPHECVGLMGAHHKHVTDRENYQPILCFDSLHTLKHHLVDNKKSHIKVSMKDFIEGTLCLNESFSYQLQSWMKSSWSYSTSFYPGENAFSHTFTERVKQATGLQTESGGKFQITSYPEGIGYKTHTDCMIHSDDPRDRYATVLVYLQDVKDGGHTQFPELGISVTPKAGQALVWNNMDASGSCDPFSLHQAQVVHNGHKVILQRWYYYENFYTLGKRMDEPAIPNRHELQPRVSCDEYEQGSCRWYDEWSYEHIIEYTDIKHSLR